MSKYPLIIEKGTNYAFVIDESKNLDFDKIREYSSEFYKMLPSKMQEKLYDEILHGACELDSEPKLNAYMFALGKMHNAKLQHAYDHLSENFLKEKQIDIIDYACGQGMGTICYADFLKRKHIKQNIRRIILIEPSEKALARASLHVSAMFPDAELITINKGFDALTCDDLLPDKNVPVLHIISNVLDMATTYNSDGFFDLEDFANLISKTIDGKNEFVCVEPLFGYVPKDEKVDAFINKVGINIYYTLTKGKGEFVKSKDWTCVIRVGKVYKNVKKNTNISKCSFDELLKKAERGDASAQFELGFYYEKGQGVIQSYKKAVEWYKKSAEQGYAKAQNNLGLCYKNGEGVEQDYKKAVFWYRKSAEQGNAKAQFNLACCYANEEGGEQDYKKTVFWCRRSAEQGYARAQFNLGYCYDEGQGVEQDYKKAVYWYRKSAEQGNARAQFYLGYCYENGYGVEINYEEAINCYQKAADEGIEIALEAIDKLKRKILEESNCKINGHEYVDLGLPSGLKWATCNVGANSPEEYGDYYAWGETETKDEYTEENSYTYGVKMNDISGDPKYDVARKKWGDNWRMPTYYEMEELIDLCFWEWKTKNGINGYKVTGWNHNSIFLPAEGVRCESSLDGDGNTGFYWSAKPFENNNRGAYYLLFCSGIKDMLPTDRIKGLSVRPVSE